MWRIALPECIAIDGFFLIIEKHSRKEREKNSWWEKSTQEQQQNLKLGRLYSSILGNEDFMLWSKEARSKDSNLLRGEPYSEAGAVSLLRLTWAYWESRCTIDENLLGSQTPVHTMLVLRLKGMSNTSQLIIVFLFQNHLQLV